MKTMIGIALACLLFSCSKENLQPIKQVLTKDQRTKMLQNAVHSIRLKTQPGNLSQREGLNIDDREKMDWRISIAEKYLLSDQEQGNFKLQEIIAIDESSDLLSFGYIQADEAEDISSSDGAFRRPEPRVLIFDGYMLCNDGCFHHGTFYITQSTGFTVFLPDNGTNNNGSGSTGFEDFCLDDEVFVGLC